MAISRSTLICDGPSDRALIPHLRWLLHENGVTAPLMIEWADMRHLPNPPRQLAERISKALELYPCELLFIHKDAERDDPKGKYQEISAALDLAQSEVDIPTHVCLVPVRMHEAWLLFDEAAVRRASGNPNGKVRINLPPLRSVENLPDPKQRLYELLRTASETSGRRLRQFNEWHSAQQVSQFISDFSPLRQLSAFQRLEADIKAINVNV